MGKNRSHAKQLRKIICIHHPQGCGSLFPTLEVQSDFFKSAVGKGLGDFTEEKLSNTT